MKQEMGRWDKQTTTEYPALSILMVMGLVLLSPFLSTYLCHGAFLICLYRMVRYDAKVFAVDYCMLMPVYQIFRTPSGMSLLIWLCLVAAIWYYVRRKVLVNGALVCLLLLLNYLIARMQMNINDFVLCFGQMFVLCVLLPRQDPQSAERACKVFCWSLAITSLYALIFRNMPQLVAVRGTETPAIWGTSIMRFMGLIKDPNYYMTLLLVGLAVLCKLKEAGRMRSVIFWSLGLVLTMFGILTYSKTFFLVFVSLGGIYIIWQFWSKKIFKGVFFATVAVAAGAYLLFSEASPFAVVMQRLTSAKNLSDLTTHRSELFVAYWGAITENIGVFFFGRGLDEPLLHGRGAHNLYLEITYYLGVVGLVLILFFYISMISGIHKNYPEIKQQSKIARYVVLLIMVVQYLALQGMFLLVTYSAWFVVVLSLYIVPKEKVDSTRKSEG